MKIVGEYEKALFVISDEPSLWNRDFSNRNQVDK